MIRRAGSNLRASESKFGGRMCGPLVIPRIYPISIHLASVQQGAAKCVQKQALGDTDGERGRALRSAAPPQTSPTVSGRLTPRLGPTSSGGDSRPRPKAPPSSGLTARLSALYQEGMVSVGRAVSGLPLLGPTA